MGILLDPVLGTPLCLQHMGDLGHGTASHPSSQGQSQKAPETWEHPVLGVCCIQAGSLEEQILSGTVWSPEITVPGIQGISQSSWKLILGYTWGSEQRGHLARVVRQDADGILSTATEQAQHGIFLGEGK